MKRAYYSKIRKISEDLGITYIKFMPEFIHKHPELSAVNANYEYYTTFFKQLTASMLDLHVLPMEGEVLFPQFLVDMCLDEYRERCKKFRWYSFAIKPKNNKMILASAVILFTLVSEDIKRERYGEQIGSNKSTDSITEVKQ